jgi:predicted heme/steroid binding protein/uncharacterized membrane protein
MKEMTREELSAFDGTEGKPVYVAYQAKVYDLTASRLWPKGVHMKRHASGRDLTADISAAPHGSDVLGRYPQVGVLRGEPPEELKHLPSFVQDFLQKFPMARRHIHPMVVHFPIAFLMGASLFALLRFFFARPAYGHVADALLLLGAFSSLFGIATGLLTWWINYRLRVTLYIKRKIQLSILLVLFEAVLLLWRNLNPETLSRESGPVYLILMLLLTPIVGFLGYYGGQLTFPD